MTRTIRIILPVVLFMVISAASVTGLSRRYNGAQTGTMNDAEAVELAEPSEYLSALGIITPKEEVESIDFSVKSLEGMEEQLSDYRGKVVFLNFWATWCPPCRAEVGDIDELYETLKDEDFMVMALSVQENRKKVLKFMESFDVDFPVFLDSDGTISAQYNVTGIPTTYIIDPDGMIVGRAVGPREWAGKESVSLMRSLMN
jgi:peroxiredoxin